MKIIGADERLSAPRGGKILIAGPTGVGKTSLLRTVDASRALLLESEAGDLSIRDVPKRLRKEVERSYGKAMGGSCCAIASEAP
jgi:ABC-type transport system involved in cytochrome c biogenesis ATPase subunit